MSGAIQPCEVLAKVNYWKDQRVLAQDPREGLTEGL